jgi:hypothetical protein
MDGFRAVAQPHPHIIGVRDGSRTVAAFKVIEDGSW